MLEIVSTLRHLHVITYTVCKTPIKVRNTRSQTLVNNMWHLESEKYDLLQTQNADKGEKYTITDQWPINSHLEIAIKNYYKPKSLPNFLMTSL